MEPAQIHSIMRAWRTAPERTRIRNTYFEPIDHPNTALWLEVDPPSKTVRWRFQFLDMGMCFVIEKAFCLRDTDAGTPEELERLVFDHYRPFTLDDQHVRDTLNASAK